MVQAHTALQDNLQGVPGYTSIGKYMGTRLDLSVTGCSSTMVDVEAHVFAAVQGNRADLQSLVSGVDMATEVAHCTT